MWKFSATQKQRILSVLTLAVNPITQEPDVTLNSSQKNLLPSFLKKNSRDV